MLKFAIHLLSSLWFYQCQLFPSFVCFMQNNNEIIIIIGFISAYLKTQRRLINTIKQHVRAKHSLKWNSAVTEYVILNRWVLSGGRGRVLMFQTSGGSSRVGEQGGWKQSMITIIHHKGCDTVSCKTGRSVLLFWAKSQCQYDHSVDIRL